jgi:hypothetical protein
MEMKTTDCIKKLRNRQEVVFIKKGKAIPVTGRGGL